MVSEYGDEQTIDCELSALQTFWLPEDSRTVYTEFERYRMDDGAVGKPRSSAFFAFAEYALDVALGHYPARSGESDFCRRAQLIETDAADRDTSFPYLYFCRARRPVQGLANAFRHFFSVDDIAVPQSLRACRARAEDLHRKFRSFSSRGYHRLHVVRADVDASVDPLHSHHCKAKMKSPLATLLGT